MKTYSTLLAMVAACLLASGCGDSAQAGSTGGTGGSDDGSGGDAGSGGTEDPFVPEAYGEWIKFEPPGAICSDGSQYAYYVNFSETSDNVMFYLMGGGACWDYESCMGGSFRGAANPEGLPDDYANKHMQVAGLDIPVDVVYPLMHADPAVSPMADWNKVFIPYCTGDVYAGNTTVTYENPEDGELVEFHHVGHANMLKVVEEVGTMFNEVPELFVGGCSAGGTGALVNYDFIRSGLNVERGYLLDDSGPMFPSSMETSRSLPLHNKVRDSWQVDDLIAGAPQSDLIFEDFGNLSTVLAEEYPEDRIALTQFRLDYNYSLYSYERFWERDGSDVFLSDDDTTIGLDEGDALDRAAVYGLWDDDNTLLTDQYDGADNLGYYIPFWRTTNDSHCVTIPGLEEFTEEEAVMLFITDFPKLAWAGSELGDMNMRDYVDHLLDSDAPLDSYFDTEPNGPLAVCMPEPLFDEELCIEAHDDYTAG